MSPVAIQSLFSSSPERPTQVNVSRCYVGSAQAHTSRDHDYLSSYQLSLDFRKSQLNVADHLLALTRCQLYVISHLLNLCGGWLHISGFWKHPVNVCLPLVFCCAINLGQGWGTLVLEIHSPAEFSTIPALPLLITWCRCAQSTRRWSTPAPGNQQWPNVRNGALQSV